MDQEHWLKWAWGPAVAYTFCLLVLSVYVVLPAAGVKAPEVATDVWLVFGGVMGIHRYQRGRKALQTKG